MNLLDAAIAAIFAYFIVTCYLRGFVRTVYSFVSFWLSASLTGLLYPYVGAALRRTGLYETVRLRVEQALFAEAAPAASLNAMELIPNLQVPDLIKGLLLANDEPSVYGLLNADSAEAYITGFVAGAVMNVIAMALVFAAVYAILRVIGAALHVVSRLPLLSTVNRLFGAALGAVMGAAVSMATVAALTWLDAAKIAPGLTGLVEGSYLAMRFGNLNWVIGWLARLAA